MRSQFEKLVQNFELEGHQFAPHKCTTTKKKIMSKRYMKFQYQLSLLITASMEVQVISQDINRKWSKHSLVRYNTLLTVLVTRWNTQKQAKKECREHEQPHYMKS